MDDMEAEHFGQLEGIEKVKARERMIQVHKQIIEKRKQVFTGAISIEIVEVEWSKNGPYF